MSAPEIEALASPALATPWVPLWPLGGQTLGELAYAELTSVLSVTATTVGTAQVVVTAPAVTVDGATPIIVEFFTPGVTPPATATYFTQLWLFEDGIAIGAVATVMTPAASSLRAPARVARRLTPAAGAHTYSIRAFSSVSGGTVYAGPGGPGADVPAFIRISLAAPISNAPAGALVPVQYGTSLPVSPVDGQEAILVDSLTAPTYSWRFRYNAGSSSAYKWEFVGGAPLHAEIFADETFTATSTWADTTGPRITLPRAGDYHAIGGCHMSSSVSDLLIMALFSGTAAQLGGYMKANMPANSWANLVQSVRGPGLAAGADIRLRHQHATAGTCHAESRWLDVTPLKVA